MPKGHAEMSPRIRGSHLWRVVSGYKLCPPQETPRTLVRYIDMHHFLLILQQQITGKLSHLGCLTISYDTIEQPLLLIQGICANLGLEMGTNLHLAIDCAAHELMDYVSFHSRTFTFCCPIIFKLELKRRAYLYIFQTYPFF